MHSTNDLMNTVLANLGKQQGTRPDLIIADARKANGGLDLLIRFDPKQGAPNRADIYKFVPAALQAPQVIVESTTHYGMAGAHGVMFAHAKKFRRPVPVEHLQANAQSFKQLSEFTYAHVGTGEVWRIESDDAGRPVMYAEDDDIDALLAAAHQGVVRMAGIGGRPTFAALQVTASGAACSEGDRVAFHCRGSRCEGVVRQCNGGMVHVMSDGGMMEVVPVGEIIEVLQMNVRDQADQEQRLEDFFAQMYQNRDFARKMLGRG